MENERRKTGGEVMNIRVLIVEDDPGCVELLRDGLTQRTETNYDVEAVSTLAAAVTRLQAGGIDAVLLDLLLPDGNGITNIARIAAAAPDVGVIVLTGWEDPALIGPARAAGADAFMFKPADTPDLSRKLQFVVIHRRCTKEFAPIEASLAELGRLVMHLNESDASHHTRDLMPPAGAPPITSAKKFEKPERISISGELIPSC